MPKDTTNYAETQPEAYEQGRRSRLSSIDQSESPYDADTDARKAWDAGFSDAEAEAARNETSGPQGAVKAEGQIETAAKANSK